MYVHVLNTTIIYMYKVINTTQEWKLNTEINIVKLNFKKNIKHYFIESLEIKFLNVLAHSLRGLDPYFEKAFLWYIDISSLP